MENECEALPGVAYPGVRDNRSTINTKTGYDDDELVVFVVNLLHVKNKIVFLYISSVNVFLSE